MWPSSPMQATTLCAFIYILHNLLAWPCMANMLMINEEEFLLCAETIPCREIKFLVELELLASCWYSLIKDQAKRKYTQNHSLSVSYSFKVSIVSIELQLPCTKWRESMWKSRFERSIGLMFNRGTQSMSMLDINWWITSWAIKSSCPPWKMLDVRMRQHEHNSHVFTVLFATSGTCLYRL